MYIKVLKNSILQNYHSSFSRSLSLLLPPLVALSYSLSVLASGSVIGSSNFIGIRRPNLVSWAMLFFRRHSCLRALIPAFLSWFWARFWAWLSFRASIAASFWASSSAFCFWSSWASEARSSPPHWSRPRRRPPCFFFEFSAYSRTACRSSSWS
jgi:hypothetical protein